MDNAKQHWNILQELGNDLANRVRSFLVIGDNGEGVIVVTENGEGYWLGTMNFGLSETKTATEPTPLNVSYLVQMAQGNQHIMLLNKRGEIYAMGMNSFGQLGLGTVDEETHFSPQFIFSPHKFTSIRCGISHSLALTKNGKVWAWGGNFFGQVGVPNSTHFLQSPRQISELDSHRVVAVECGSSYSLALTDQGEVYGWGFNSLGQLGDRSGSLENHNINIIKLIPTLSPVKSMAASSYHTLLLTQTGEVYACGRNNCGQLGLPTDTEISLCLSRVLGLPSILQIASHTRSELSIAMSFDLRCFVWGRLRNETSISTPRELPPFYSTVDSPLSFYSTRRNTPHSVSIPETSPSPLSTRMSRMFDNPETSPDVQFVVEQRTIHAHRIILSNSSDYFARMFSERWINPIGKVTISDYSYQVFHAFLRFVYTGFLEVHPDLLPELFEIASQYLEFDLYQTCLSRMRTTFTTSNCCLYYHLTLRHSLPNLATFHQELAQFISTNFFEVIKSAAFQSMDAELCKKLTIFITNHSPQNIKTY